MIDNTKEWLANHYKISKGDVESYFKNEDVSGFLIIWTIFEQKLFKGYLKFKDLKEYSSQNNLQSDKLEDEFSFFFDIYKEDKGRYNNLIHGENIEEIKLILSSIKTEISKNNKLLFILYVVYRYRNNIFYGNKGVFSWIKYKDEINYCVRIMQILLDE